MIGEPPSLGRRQTLASDDRYQFQWWALSLVGASRWAAASGASKGKKGTDKGIDGGIYFIDDASGKPKQVMVQVKAGHVNGATRARPARRDRAGGGRDRRADHAGAAQPST